MAEELDEAVNDIIAQLKQNNKVAKAPVEESVLNKEDLEDFLFGERLDHEKNEFDVVLFLAALLRCCIIALLLHSDVIL